MTTPAYPGQPAPPHGRSWHKEPPIDTAQERLLGLIRKNPGINTDELARRMKTPAHKLRADLVRLHKERGLIGRQQPLEAHVLWSTWYPETVGP